MKALTSVGAFCCLAWLTLATFACGDPVVSASLELADSLVGLAETPDWAVAPESVIRGSEGSTLVVDASESMAGFAGCLSSTTLFDETLDRLSVALAADTVLLFGDSPDPTVPVLLSRQLNHAIHCPATFNRLQNPDHRLLEIISSDSTKVPTVYLTDGVQSARDIGTPSPSMNAMADWLRRGGTIAILAFKSRYRGPVWSEKAQRWLAKVDTLRPFYAFIFAQNLNVAENVMARLPPELLASAIPAVFSIESQPECRVGLAPFREQGQESPPWAFLRQPEVQNIRANAGVIGTLECALPGYYPVERVQADVQIAGFFEWQGHGFAPQSQPPPGTSVVVQDFPGGNGQSGGSSTGNIDAVFPPSPNSNFAFYHIRLEPRRGFFRNDLNELSTDNDGSVENAHLTYRFDWLLAHLTRAVFELDNQSLDYFITVEYR